MGFCFMFDITNSKVIKGYLIKIINLNLIVVKNSFKISLNC